MIKRLSIKLYVNFLSVQEKKIYAGSKRKRQKTFTERDLHLKLGGGRDEKASLRVREIAFVVFSQLKGKTPRIIYAICGPIGRDRSLVSHLIFILFKGLKKNRLKMAGLDCGMKCLKFLLCVFNLVFWVSQASNFQTFFSF